MDLRRYEEARTLYLQMLQSCPKDPYYEAVLYNNIAWANVLIGNPETLPESLAYSDKAFNPYRTVSAFQGTRGAVLVASGQVAEGIPLLESFFQSKTDDDKQGRALNACILARAEKKLGNAAASAQWLQTACDLHPQCSLLPRFSQDSQNG